MSEIVKYTAGGNEITLSLDTVMNYIAPKNATRQEGMMFLELCRHQGLNPWLREAYLIKYDSGPAQMVVGKEAFTKRANAQPTFQGFEAGIVVQRKGSSTFDYRQGSMVAPGETLIGGWCKVYREGWKIPIVAEVALHEYTTGKSNWGSKPGTMIRKVAICQALREAYPDALGAMYGAEEMQISSPLSEAPIEPPASNKPQYDIDIVAEIKEVPPEPDPRFLPITGEQRDEIWRIFKGDTRLAAALYEKIGKKIEDINAGAFKRALKIAKEIAEAAYGAELEPPLDEAPCEPEYISAEEYSNLEILIGDCANADEVNEKLLEHFGIESLGQLMASNAEEAKVLIEREKTPF